jgi:type III restriction enzyme
MAPANLFFEQPVLNSPYVYPARHWELDGQGIELDLFASHEHTRDGQQYDPTPIINLLRETVDAWRELPSPNDWKVTPETARLL